VAPTNAAMAGGSQNKATLARRMSYLIVPSKYDSQALLRLINETGGDARLRTAEGGTLVARMNRSTNIVVMNKKGSIADIVIHGVRDKYGIIPCRGPRARAQRHRPPGGLELIARVFCEVIGHGLWRHAAGI